MHIVRARHHGIRGVLTFTLSGDK